MVAPLLPALGCSGLQEMLRPPQEQGAGPAAGAAMDEPPPLHTGGLSVISGHPDAPGHHGNPVAEAVATGIGAGVIGATVVETAVNCAQPGASAECLAGPGPADTVGDAGAQ
jgi:hypothetical protein